MKNLLTICIVLGLISVASAAYIETFTGSSAGWLYEYGTNWTLGSTTYLASGGNPGGYVSGVSLNLYAAEYSYANDNVYATFGDMTGLTITIDTKITDSEVGTAQFYIGRSGTYYIQTVGWSISNNINWTTHSAPLDTSNFSHWANSYNTYSFSEVLQHPTDMGIFFGGGVSSGTGALLIDNFGAIPEPATISILGLGALSLFRKKK